MCGRPRSRAASAPLPLLMGFGLFVATLVYLVAVSLTRRDAPVFTPSSAVRVRPADWMRAGDTLTVDATDGERWRFVSLTEGRPLTGADTARWQLAVRRYRVTVAGALADLGHVPFARARVRASARFVSSRPGETENEVMGHWYRYSLLTHLLMPDGRVYALRDRDGRLWKLQVLGYYCPKLIAGCLTLRYAPL
jgi:hypothetical protein